jgi:hypothetical protein
VAFAALLDDRACAEETDPGEQALYDAAHALGVHARLLGRDDEERHAQSHQHVGAQARAAAALLAVIAHDGCQEHRKEQPHHHASQVRGVGEIREFSVKRGAYRFPHFGPVLA